mmetsp:Transcript_10868/g.21636  ORF Transcript_10868/g.21636 Transcript_10868/m.21636 type:complete len:301 (+) Transcript_10868:390-1292(+)
MILDGLTECVMLRAGQLRSRQSGRVTTPALRSVSVSDRILLKKCSLLEGCLCLASRGRDSPSSPPAFSSSNSFLVFSFATLTPSASMMPSMHSFTIKAAARFPPADSPETAMRRGLKPSSLAASPEARATYMSVTWLSATGKWWLGRRSYSGTTTTAFATADHSASQGMSVAVVWMNQPPPVMWKMTSFSSMPFRSTLMPSDPCSSAISGRSFLDFCLLVLSMAAEITGWGECDMRRHGVPPMTTRSTSSMPLSRRLASRLSHLIGGRVTIPHALLMKPMSGACTYLAASLLVTSLPATA